MGESPASAHDRWWALLGRLVAGVMLFSQVFLPWGRQGALSQSSSLDALVLIRTGTVSALVPTSAAALLLGLPALGVILAFLASATRPGARIAAFVTVGLAALVWTVLSCVLDTLEVSMWGAGGLVTMLGIALGVICLSPLARTVGSS